MADLSSYISMMRSAGSRACRDLPYSLHVAFDREQSEPRCGCFAIPALGTVQDHGLLLTLGPLEPGCPPESGQDLDG